MSRPEPSGELALLALRYAAGEVADLVPAARPRRHHGRVRGRIQLRNQVEIRDPHAQVVVLLLVAEGPRHAAAARVERGRIAARAHQRVHRSRYAHERALVAVRME